MTLPSVMLNRLGITEDELAGLLIQDVHEIFSTMIGMEDLKIAPVPIEPVNLFRDGITAMVGLVGTYNGIVSLHGSRPLACKISSKILGASVIGVNENVLDAVGEIANMITGSFKLHVSAGGLDIRISTPSVVTGDEYIISLCGAHDTLTLLYDIDDEWLIVSVAIEREQEGQTSPA